MIRKGIQHQTYTTHLPAFIIINNRSYSAFFEHFLTLLPNAKIKFAINKNLIIKKQKQQLTGVCKHVVT
jgi:hypothetical protein